MKSYGQFCPIAKASEILGERWTHLVIRELAAGSEAFNDLRKGLPLMSPSLLSARLKSLEAAGVVERAEANGQVRYSLTEAGRELKPILTAMGTWGHRWARSKLGKEDLDPSLLMWDIHRTMNAEYFGRERTVLLFEFGDYAAKFRRWWLVIEDGDVDVCMKDPGYEVDLLVATDVQTLTAIWMGDIGLGQAIRSQRLKLSGPARLKRDISTWLGSNYFRGREAGCLTEPVASEIYVLRRMTGSHILTVYQRETPRESPPRATAGFMAVRAPRGKHWSLLLSCSCRHPRGQRRRCRWKCRCPAPSRARSAISNPPTAATTVTRTTAPSSRFRRTGAAA